MYILYEKEGTGFWVLGFGCWVLTATAFSFFVVAGFTAMYVL